MQADITFSENTTRMATADCLSKGMIPKPIAGLRNFIEEGDWDERLLRYEKHLNRICLGIIFAAAAFFLPVCLNIFSR